MGWSAYANVENNSKMEIINNSRHVELFKNAYQNVNAIFGSKWHYCIKNGYIEGHNTATMLSKALSGVSLSPYDNEWTAEQVRQANKHAQWWACDFIIEDEEDEFAMQNAKYFLKACALAGVGIRFSY